MKLEIPGREPIEIRSVVFDYNGTVAVDGSVIKGVSEKIDLLKGKFDFYVITADTYGSVKRELEGTACEVITIPAENQDQSKAEFVRRLGAATTIAAGNGRNDKIMLREAVIGIALLQEEGVCTETLMNSDIVMTSIFDLFASLENPQRLVATLRN